MSDNSFEKPKEETKGSQKTTLAKFNLERQQRLDKLCLLSLLGFSITMVVTSYLISANPRITKHWTLIFAVTLAIVVIYFTWLISSWKQYHEWKKTEKAKLLR